jgi:uncharacterized protein (TIGR03067 family)
MKKVLLPLIIMLPVFLFAQQNERIIEENLRLKSRIDSLEGKMDEKYYTRVPNKDLDNKLSDMVNDEVGNYIGGKIALVSTIIGIISFLLGFLAKYFFSESTRKQIDENVKTFSDKINKDNEEAHKKLETLMNEQKEFINTTNRLNDDRIKEMNLRFENLRSILDNQIQQFAVNTNKNISDFQNNTNAGLKKSDEQLNKIVDSVQTSLKTIQAAQENFEKLSGDKIESKFTETFDFLWGDIISGMIDRAAQKNFNGQSLIADFEKVLNKDLKVSIELKVKTIDTLMRCYFSTAKLEKKYEKMVALIRNYEDKYDLLPETYVNAAIALANNYELFGTEDLREAAISNCNKSIQKDRDYGVPYAIKMEILAISIMKVREEEMKEKSRDEIEELLYLVDRIPSPLLKGEFLERLLQDKDVPYLKNYIEQLYSDYAKELTPYRENVVEQLVKNYSLTNEKEKKLFTNLLQEGLMLHPNLDGSWKADSFLDAGNPVDLAKSEVYLVLNASQYSLTSSAGFKDSGVIYFMPNLIPYAFSLIAQEGENKLKIVRGIYTYDHDNGKLILCFNLPENARPAEFSSTVENSFSLISFSLLS